MIRPRHVWIAAALALAFWISGNCREAIGVRRGAQGVHDTENNITIARMAGETVVREAAFRHERDSTARVIAKLKARILPRDSIVLHDTVQVAAQLGVRDSVITALDARHAQDSLQVLFWKTQAVAYRDSLVPALIQARDNWKRAAEPGLLTQAIRAVPYVLAGAVLWEAVR